MTKKDFTITENQDLSDTVPVGRQADNGTTATPSGQIKNAHATGDGSFGRNDESLPEESEVEDKAKESNSNY